MVTPSEGKLQRKRISHNCLQVNLMHYNRILEPVFHSLQHEYGWSFFHEIFEIEDAVIDHGSINQNFVFTQTFLEDSHERELREAQLFNPDINEEVRIFIGPQLHDVFAHVYLMPLFDGQGFIFEAGEYYRLPIINGYITLPLKLSQLPISSWQYQIDAHIETEETGKNIRTSLVVLDRKRVRNVSVVHFSEYSSIEPGSALMRQAAASPVCEEGKYCPLFVVHSSEKIPPRSEIPLYAVTLTDEQTGALPASMFKGVDGVIWSDNPGYKAEGALAHFAKRLVTAGEDKTVDALIDCLPTEFAKGVGTKSQMGRRHSLSSSIHL
ncbi:hypothetical protein E1189_08910 [Sansalvadorimonas verongulae]|nr:hypothetical protein [Sansalvadorimonas verongulae]